MKRTIGYLSFGLLFLLILVLGWATWEEHLKGTEYVMRHFYRTPWFNVLWAWLALTGGYYILKKELYRKLPVFLLHLSLIIILTGALITRFNGQTGVIHLRQDQTNHVFDCEEAQRHLPLPFFMTLKEFRIEYYPGTSSPSDYISLIEVKDNETGKSFEQEISMNKILRHKGYRFYQSSFDEDMKGSILSINHDTTGIAFTYTGYYLLFFSMLWMLVDRKGRFMELLRKIKVNNE